MIATFPDPYDGELFYSVLARFAGRMKYPTPNIALRELFGARHGVPAIELPNKIDALLKQLPPGNLYSSDTILQKHTLLPFYAPFLPERNYELIVADMKGDGHRTTQLRAGIIAGRISPPEYFRSCPVCDKESLARHGETYWHRLHQISGVEVCSVHSVFLEHSNVRLAGSAQKDALFSAESAQCGIVAKSLDSGKAEHKFLLRVARSASWLLDTNLSRPGLVEIRRRYRQILADRDCLTPRGCIRFKRLHEKFAECCTEDRLKQFNCELLHGSDGGWLARLFRETAQATAPLRHLAIMAVLDVSAEEFFTPLLSKSAERPITYYPCLNTKCPQFGELVIPNFEIKRTNYGVARIFECPHCGHRSSRTVDGRSLIRVVSFGELSMQQLKLLWADSSRSVENISTELNADARSVTKYAAELGLEFPRRGPGRRTNRPNPRVVKRLPPALSMGQNREAWRHLREKNPRATISQLHQVAPALYTWLYRHDRQWLRENSPPHRKFAPKNTGVDWKARDNDLADRVISAATLLKNDPDRRRRVTVRAIGLELGLHPLLRKYRRNLPRTRLALESQVESTEQFALLRIRRTLESFVRNRRCATRSDIFRAAGISGSTVNQLPSVRRAIIDAKDALDQCLNGEFCALNDTGIVPERFPQTQKPVSGNCSFQE